MRYGPATTSGAGTKRPWAMPRLRGSHSGSGRNWRSSSSTCCTWSSTACATTFGIDAPNHRRALPPSDCGYTETTKVATLEASPVEVGVRELRNNFSRYLDRVRDGEELVVTDRGRAIARMLPVETERVLDRLIAEGVVTRAKQPKRQANKPLKIKGTVSDLVADQRR